MSMFSRSCTLATLVAMATTAWAAEAPRLGEPVTREHAASPAVSLTVFPDGTGLPPGSGDARAGRTLYQQHCLACHGVDGQGGPNDRLVGGRGSLATATPIKTVGSFWPYATTLFSYVRRAMPHQAPGSLDADTTYALTAYLLHLNGIVDETATMDARTLPQVQMPNRDGFRGGPT